jgi:potassium-dependent mechanosensitive channel
MMRHDFAHFDAKHCVCYPLHLTKRLMMINLPLLRRSIAALVLIMASVFAVPQAAFAQSPSAKTEEAEAISEINTHLIELQKIAAKVGESLQNDDALLEARLAAEQKSRDLIAASVRFRPIIKDITQRLETFKGATAEGATPAPEITAGIKLLNTRKSAINSAMAKAEDGTLEAASLVERIGVARRDLFSSQLSQRVELGQIFNPQTARDIGAEGRDFSRRVTSWFSFMLRFKLSAVTTATMLALVAALAFLRVGSVWARPFARHDEPDYRPGYLTRIVSALTATLVPAVTLGVFLATVYYLMDWFTILRPDIAEILGSVMRFIWQVFFVYRLALAILQPSRQPWRLLNVTDGTARLLLVLATFLAIITSADTLLNAISTTLSSPFSLTVARSFVFAILIGLLLLTIAFLKPFQNEDGTLKPWPTYAWFTILAAGLAPIMAGLFGYVGLARFLTQQIVVTGAIAATMIVGFLCAQALADEDALKSSSIGRALHGRFGLTDRQLDLTAMMTSLFTYGLVLFVGVPLILLQWGFKWTDLLLTARNFLTELQIGSVTISITAIAIGILVFFAGYYLSGRFEHWLDKTVLSRARMDKGARTSIRTAVGYLGIALAALVGISVAGVQLSSLALVAGALSVGIGFGLQNIVSNFVSGLILLAERPFKEGDWIEAGSINGIVKKVSVRATEIETFQKQSVILPNSILINAAVGNWTHRNTLARLDVPVVVSYGADVVKVQNILRSIATAHPKILKTPEPFVLFKGFGAERLEFELRFFIADLFEQSVIGTEVRFEIVKRFRQDGVDLPYQQHDAMHSIFADDPDIGAVAVVTEPAIVEAPVIIRKPAKG